METDALIYVSGRVQKVYFRGFTQERAKELGLKGYAQNLPDGRVKVVVRGSKEAIMRLIAVLHTGPGLASVTDVEVNWKEADEEFEDFVIRR